MINIIQIKLVVNRAEEVPHPQSIGMMMPGPVVEQYEITFTTKERDILAGVTDCCNKAITYAKQVEVGASDEARAAAKQRH